MANERWFMQEHGSTGEITAMCLTCKTVIKIKPEWAPQIMQDPAWYLNCPCNENECGHA